MRAILQNRCLVILALLLLAMSFTACEKQEPDCFQNKQVFTWMAFTEKKLVRVDSMIDSVLVDTTVVRYKDTLFKSPVLISIGMANNIRVIGSQYNNFIGAPLNPDTHSLRYALVYDTTKSMSDTITYFYNSSVHFISNACGFTNFYHIDSVRTTKHLIDSVVLKERDVTDKASDRHLILYFFH